MLVREHLGQKLTLRGVPARLHHDVDRPIPVTVTLRRTAREEQLEFA